MTDAELMAKAERIAKESKAIRAQVGACLKLADSDATVLAFNGMPFELKNESCEIEMSDGSLVTRIELIHAEAKIVSICAREGIKTDGATMYITLSPCIECAKLMYGAGIRRVVYRDQYRITDGIAFLKKVGVAVEQIKREDK